MQSEAATSYVPELGFKFLTPLYDPVVAVTTREQTFKNHLVDQANIRPEHSVLDLGCGTGTLAILLKQTQFRARIVGLDADEEVLAKARRKALDAGADVEFDQGFSDRLPYPDQSFDRVVSSLFLHHLTPTQKRVTLREVVRVLRPGGEVHIADWGRARGPLMRALFLGIQLLDGFENTREHVEGRLPELLSSARLTRISTREEFSTLYGTLSLYSATRSVC